MSRLPVVSSDGNAWGTILNDFLSVAHNSDGSLKNPFFNVRDPAYGCKVDGATDDSTGLAAALAAANAAGGGIVTGFNGGTCLTGNQSLYPNVHIDLQGGTIKLKNGANTDLFSGQTNLINPAAAITSGSDGTLYNFSIRNGILDGNYTNQTGGPSWVLRFYGYGYTLDNLRVKNGYSGGILSDWNGTGIHNHDGIEAQWSNVKVHDCQGGLGARGIFFSGPHDSQFTNVFSFANFGHGLHIGPNAPGLLFTNYHGWGNFGTGTIDTLIEAGDCAFTNPVFESNSDTTVYTVVLAASQCSMKSARLISSGAFSGIQLGQNSGETPVTGQIRQSAGTTTYNPADKSSLDLICEAFTGTHGAINFDIIHNSKITAVIAQTSGTAYTGFLDPTNSFELLPPSGLTADGTVGKGGQTHVSAESGTAFMVGGTNYLDYFNVSTYSDQRADLMNGAYLQFWSDQLTTRVGAFFTGSGVPSGTTGGVGDFYFRIDTPSTANQRIYIKTASSTWTGIL